jgi:hypothetical protein
MKNLDFDMPAGYPRSSRINSSQLMVKKSHLARYSFSDIDGYLHLGIGAAFADDCDSPGRGLAGNLAERICAA